MSGELIRGLLGLVRMDNAAAVAYTNRGAGRPPDLTLLARAVTEREIRLICTAAALRTVGRDNTAVAALSRFSLRETGGDPLPVRELRSRPRAEVEA